MYDHETPTPALLREHIREMLDTLALINELLNGTPYQPGATWVATLPLDDEKMKRAQSLVTDAEGKASLVRVYATHIRNVLDAAKPSLPSLPTPALPGMLPGLPGMPAGVPGVPAMPAPTAIPGYASLHDALVHVHPALVKGNDLEQRLTRDANDATQRYEAMKTEADVDPATLAQVESARQHIVADLTRLHEKLSRPISPADVTDPENARIVSDAVTVTSVALRLTVEAISLATVAGLEAASLTRDSGRQWLINAPATAELIAELPEDGRRAYQELATFSSSLRDLLDMLSALTHVDPLTTVGFKFKEGLVDDIVGLAWDSVHLEAQGAGEALFYTNLPDAEQSTDSKGNSYDYTGRQRKLSYNVQPIILASAQLRIKLDWAHWMDAAGLKIGYATNRFYKSGGDLGTGSLANELGVKGKWSEAFNAALAIAGVNASVRLAHFNHGTVRETLVTDGSELAEAPLTFDMKQIDVGYDLAPRHSQLIKSLIVGFRYFDYTLPRVLYELVNSTPGADTAAYVFSRETPPQSIRTRFYMADVAARFEKEVSPHFKPYVTVDLAAGYGPTHYYFLKDQDGDDVESNHDNSSSSGAGFGFGGALGFRWQLGGPEARVNAFLDAYYHVQLISSLLDSKNSGDTIVQVGATDLFHGPVASFGAMF
ncbi:MAG TPA: hypothetical protein VH062_13325 [Polyangiaceae bacterium]|jgi:hypothetical protein|nr:hypothetical protein [Polyangiaceae bacterium]